MIKRLAPPAAIPRSGIGPPAMLKPEDWKELAKSILDGQCTPFLGAGACVPTLPTGSELSHMLAREFDYPLELQL